jgi:L-erythro-3,5-diaminohexanoate dehydrogenase
VEPRNLEMARLNAQANRLARPGEIIYILGAGKAGLLCAAAIRAKLGRDCTVLVSDVHSAAAEALVSMGLADQAFAANALHAGQTMDQVARATGGKMADLVINTANIEGTELAAALSCRQGGRVYFFNMATSFQKAALGAEGVGLDVEMLIGNGYAPGHAELTLQLYRQNPAVKRWFDERFGG